MWKNKYHIVLPLLAALFTIGCSSDDAADEQLESVPLSFIVTAEELQDANDATRAAAITSSTISDMRLTGIKYLTTSSIDAASPSDYFYNGVVNKTSSWTVSGIAWPGKKENVQFFAYAPSVASSNGLTLSASSQTGVPSFTYALPDNATNQQDVMVATSGELAGNNGAAIPLTFTHLCARVIVNVGDAGLNNKTVTEVKFLNVCKTASYTFGASGFTNVGTLGNVTTGSISYNSTNNAGKQIGGESYTFMMLPQTLSTTTGSKATLSITYGSATKTREITGTWEAGKTYVYNIHEAFTKNFSYTGSVQSFTVPAAGKYQIECWGASGGGSIVESKASPNTESLGAYTVGTISLTKNRTLYIYVGGKGADAVESKNVSGGWNGGGNGKSDIDDNESDGAGGGATDVRLTNGDWDNFNSLKSRIMVAAGGAGRDFQGGGTANTGYAGGLYSNAMTYASGATQTSGYQFGKGANATSYGGPSIGADTGSSGAGGGYWGGNVSNSSLHNNNHHSGSGGSCYISGFSGCKAIKSGATSATASNFESHANHYSGLVFDSGAEMYDGAGYKWSSSGPAATAVGFNSPSGSNEFGHSGNGYCRITLISLE